MTDINLAYSLNEDDENDNIQSIQNNKKQLQTSNDNMPDLERIKEQRREQIHQQISQQSIPQIPPQMLKPNNMPPQTKETYVNYNNNYNNNYSNNYNNQRRNPEYSFWDRMIMSKREVLKLFILSIVIILGISLEKIGSHYITKYLNSTDLSSIQELLVRLSFPIIVFIILWIIKSL